MSQNFYDFGKIFITIGLLFIIIGLIISLIGKIPLIGKLPGDIYIKKERFVFYFPIVTSIIISIILTILINIFFRR